MTYSIARPPFSLLFDEMSKAELKGYNDWFHEVRAERIALLEAEVRERSPGWRADLTRASLAPLGEWFASQVASRPRTREELKSLGASLPPGVQAPESDLTERTYSLAFDIGMYFAETLVKNLPGVRWDQPVRNKSFVDYGQPVLMGFGSVPLNPQRIAQVIARGIMNETKTGAALQNTYDTWATRYRPPTAKR